MQRRNFLVGALAVLATSNEAIACGPDLAQLPRGNFSNLLIQLTKATEAVWHGKASNYYFAQERAGLDAAAELGKKLENDVSFDKLTDYESREKILDAIEPLKNYAEEEAKIDFSKKEPGRSMLKSIMETAAYKQQSSLIERVISYIEESKNKKEVQDWYNDYSKRIRLRCGPGYPDEPDQETVFLPNSVPTTPLTIIVQKIESTIRIQASPKQRLGNPSP